jgi:putative phosphoribosyl transferase
VSVTFTDRADAGRRLAGPLAGYAGRAHVVVLGLPRGGVPVAAEVAAALRAPLDVCLVRKLGAPGHEEYAIGAIASGGVRVVNERAVTGLGIGPAELDRVTARERAELARRERAYRGDRPPLPLAGTVVILVDDGLATGSTMRAAVAAVRAQRPARVVVAVPVGAPEACRRLAGGASAAGDAADEVVCLTAPPGFRAVGQFYDDFSPPSDDDVRRLLSEAGRP